MKHTPLNPKSLRKIRQLIEEEPIRVKLTERCSGTPVKIKRKVRMNNGNIYEYNQVICMGGICEICGKPSGGELGLLFPHEKISRGHLGKLSLENSVMCHNKPCHAIAQNNIVKWSKNDNL